MGKLTRELPNILIKKEKIAMKKTTSSLALILTAVSLLFINTPLYASNTDDQIESSIKHSYVFKTYVNSDDVDVQSKDGVVSLTGSVSNESSKLLAGETVASQPGVKGFDNKLKVKGEFPAANSDAWVINQVKTTLWFHRNVNATETEVLAKDGTVTLRGNASSTAQKDLTTEYAQDVEGVKTVKNEMVIVSDTAMKPGKKAVGQQQDAMAEMIDDASITALVKTTLLHHRSTSALRTTVETKNGVVHLGGKARNAAEKDLASKLVNDVHGVKMVINDMTLN